jgi:hypothetical protein
MENWCEINLIGKIIIYFYCMAFNYLEYDYEIKIFFKMKIKIKNKLFN